MLQFAVKCRFDIKEKALISLIIRALCNFAVLKSDPLGARTQDPNIKSVVLYLLS